MLEFARVQVIMIDRCDNIAGSRCNACTTIAQASRTNIVVRTQKHEKATKERTIHEPLRERVQAWNRHFYLLCQRLLWVDFWTVFGLQNVIVMIMGWLIAGGVFWRPPLDAGGLFDRAVIPLFIAGVAFWFSIFGVFPRFYGYAHLLFKDLQVGNHGMTAFWAR